jgi:hypothetical protein
VTFIENFIKKRVFDVENAEFGHFQAFSALKKSFFKPYRKILLFPGLAPLQRGWLYANRYQKHKANLSLVQSRKHVFSSHSPAKECDIDRPLSKDYPETGKRGIAHCG